jgi:hypothetical protein
MLFRFLCREEEFNGVLLRHDMMAIMRTMTILALIGVMIYGSILCSWRIKNGAAFVPAIWIYGAVPARWIYKGIIEVINFFLVGLLLRSVNSLTLSLVNKLGM